MRIVKEAFDYTFSHGGRVTVPQGARVDPIAGEPGVYWLHPNTFPRHSLDRHDALYRGVRVPEFMTVEN